jgi:hypothetical protein
MIDVGEKDGYVVAVGWEDEVTLGHGEGNNEDLRLGVTDGIVEGDKVGTTDGIEEGVVLGSLEICAVGVALGKKVGEDEDTRLGLEENATRGKPVGLLVELDGMLVYLSATGLFVGFIVIGGSEQEHCVETRSFKRLHVSELYWFSTSLARIYSSTPHVVLIGTETPAVSMASASGLETLSSSFSHRLHLGSSKIM